MLSTEKPLLRPTKGNLIFLLRKREEFLRDMPHPPTSITTTTTEEANFCIRTTSASGHIPTVGMRCHRPSVAGETQKVAAGEGHSSISQSRAVKIKQKVVSFRTEGKKSINWFVGNNQDLSENVFPATRGAMWLPPSSPFACHSTSLQRLRRTTRFSTFTILAH